MSTIPHLTLTDKNGVVYDFPPSLFLTSDGANVRSSIKELLFAHGGRQVGDGFVASRQINIEGVLIADTSAAFETAYRALVRALLKGGDLTVHSDSVARYIAVNNPTIDQDWVYWPRAKNVSIVLNAPFPFWQDSVEVEETHIMAGNGSFTVDLSGSDHIVLPEVEVDSDQAADVPGILLRNVTDGGAVMVYNNPNFTAGNVLVIDSGDGSIMLNNNDAIGYFISGSFLRLQPVVNTIYYEGAACTILVRYRRLYL